MARMLVGPAAGRLDDCAGFVLAAGSAGAIAHTLALAQLANVWVLRVGGAALALAGLAQCCAWARTGRTYRHRWSADFRALTGLSRLMVIVGGVVFVALGLTALAPPTDIDSLHVYLAIPLDWLRHGGAYPRTDLLHARLLGLGEGLTMIGLATGTDTLAANLQFAGLVIAAAAVADSAKHRLAAIRGMLCVLACPAMLGLVSTQKFQVLPAAALTVAFIVIVQHWDHFDSRRATLAFGSMAFAMACKYSFLLSGSVVLAMGLVAAARSGRLAAAARIAVACVAVLAMPIYLRNWRFYGDPLSPFLEHFSAHPDPALIWMADRLRTDLPQSWMERLVRLPFALLGTVTPSRLSEPLGVAVLLAGLVRSDNQKTRLLLTGLAIGVIPMIALSQLTPRFFLEACLWSIAAATIAGSLRFDWLFDRVLLAQSTVVALAACILAAQLAPGALSAAARDRVMARSANGYEEARWIDRIVPADAAVLPASQSYFLLSRPFLANDRLAEQLLPTAWHLHRYLAAHHISVAVRPYPLDDRWRDLILACGQVLAGPTEFAWAARNPFNRGEVSQYIAVSLDLARTGCL